MIYDTPGSDDPLDQADIVSRCPILSLTDFDLEGVKPPQIQVSTCRILVLTQACDLANRKASSVTVAVVHDAHALVEQNIIKPADVRGPIRAGRVFGWYYLPASTGCGLPEMIVDLRQIHTVRPDLLDGPGPAADIDQPDLFLPIGNTPLSTSPIRTGRIGLPAV